MRFSESNERRRRQRPILTFRTTTKQHKLFMLLSVVSPEAAAGCRGRVDVPPIGSNAPCRTRTCDPRIRNPLLYPAELRAQRKSQLGTLLCPRVEARQGDLRRIKDGDREIEGPAN